MIEITLTIAGETARYQLPDDKLDAALDAADRRFLPELTQADERRFRAILAADEKRRASAASNVPANAWGRPKTAIPAESEAGVATTLAT